jgi:hypothetical protein
MTEPRHADEYTRRQIDAAKRVLVDVGQVLAAFRDCMVLIGGWVPELLIENPEEPHIGSIDVDLALDIARLRDGRFGEMLKVLLDTRRYAPGEKAFQLVTVVDLSDGLPPVRVDVEFLAPAGVRLRSPKEKRVPGFRVLQAKGVSSALKAPEVIEVSGPMIDGAKNTVRVRVASLADFLVMKCHALAGRDKPKDAYDLVYCLENVPDGIASLAGIWAARIAEPEVSEAVRILREKFDSVDSFGPMRVLEFRDATSAEERSMDARRAFEVVQAFLHRLT